MSIYKRTGSPFWLLDVEGRDGRRVRRSSGTEDWAVARVKEAQLRLQLQLSDPVFDIPRSSQSIQLGELVEQFLAYQRQMHPRSMSSYYLPQVKVFQDWAGADRSLDSITLKDLQAFQAQRLAGSSPTTSNRCVAVVKTLFRLAVDWGHLQENPARRIKKFREPGGRRRFLDASEQARLLAACQEPFRQVVLVALRTGMRRGELLGLRKRDVDFSRSHLTLLRTKTDTPRHIPLLPEVRETLLALARDLPDDAQLLRTRNRQPYERFTVRKNFQRARVRAGLPDVRFHDLRHTFASDCLAAGVPMAVLRDWLGHSSVRTTERYAHLADRQIQMALHALDQHLAAQKQPVYGTVPSS